MNVLKNNSYLYIKKRIILFFILIVFQIEILFLFMHYNSRPKIAYIDNVSVYGSFQLTQEIKNKINLYTNKRDHIIDSLELIIENIQLRLEKNPTNEILKNELLKSKEEYYFIDSKFKDEAQKMISDYEKTIWEQLNQYITDYGKESDFIIIHGVSGNGNIMYAKEYMDKTEEVISYVNKKYNDISK